jgi:Pentapeptide repeats (8 copies)
MTQQEIQKVLELHKEWLKDGTKGQRADLSGAYLSGADLSGANLSGACLSGANLSGANLSGANLSGANLSGAYLSGAYLFWACLSGACLSGACLSGACLSGADLSGAYLSGADLSGACLSGAKIMTFQFLKNICHYTFTDSIKIGCYYETIDWWLKNYKKVGKKEGYADLEIKLYGQFIKNCDKIHKKYLKEIK